MFWTAVVVLLLLYLLFDVPYFARCLYLAIEIWFEPKLKISDVATLSGRCTFRDLDLMLHMNNARYLRECDFARIRFWLRSGVWHAMKRLGGQITLGATLIRYRKSVEFWEKYEVRTKVLCWDDKAFYLENAFVRPRDGFVMAIVFQKQALLRVSPADVIKQASGEVVTSPPPPPEIQKLIECNQISSYNLKKRS